MSMYKVCIIVDNPLRDLDGIILVARHLVEKGCKVYLVPMYTQGYEVATICPDIVIVNYVRSANISLIKAYSKAGICVGVLDTEGGVVKSREVYVRGMTHEEGAADIGFICLWGEVQYKALLELSKFKEEQLILTGSPRHDFYSKQWKNALPKLYDNGKPVILLTTTFPLSFPLFTGDVDKEIKTLLDAGQDKEYLLERVKDEKRIREDIISVVQSLSADFQNAEIIVRPHPFENGEQYHDSFKGCPNVSVIMEGAVAKWVNASDVILHMNSSVSLDATLNAKTPISLDWILSDTVRSMSKLSYDVSYKAKSYEDLVKVIAASLGGEKFVSDDFLSDDLKSEIESWFYLSDGNASLRVADAVMKSLKSLEHFKSSSFCRAMSWYGSKNFKSPVGWIDGIGRKTIGPVNYDWLRTWALKTIRGFGHGQAKRFTLEKVEEIMSNISECSNSESQFKVEPFMKENALFNRMAGQSIAISMKK